MAALLLAAAPPAASLAVPAGPADIAQPAVAPPAEATAGTVYRGRTLAEVLEDLRRRGLPLVYTSETVRPGMRVETEPAGDDPAEVVRQVLTPHGLTVLEDPSGILVVIPGAPPDPPVAGAGVRGRVETAEGAPLAGAEVWLGGGAEGARTDAAGRFRFEVPEGGRFTLEARAPGYLAERVPDLHLTPGQVRQVVFRLRPQPLLRDEIVVRPSRLSLLREHPESAFALSRDELTGLPQLGGDLFRAAGLLPGIAANDVGAAFSVRGGRRDEVRILLDGQELYEAFHLLDYDRALSIVDVHSVAAASLATGNFPVRHGDRMGGVLELESLDPGPPSSHRLRLGVGALNALLSTTGATADGVHWLATVRRGSLDLAGPAVGDDDPLYWDAFAKAGTDLAAGTWTLHLLTTGDELALDKREEDGFEVLTNDYRSTYGWLHGQLSPRPSLLVAGRVGRSRVGRHRRATAVDEEGGYRLRDRRRLDVTEAGLEASWFGGDAAGVLAAGGEWRRYDASFDYHRDLDPEFLVLPPDTPPVPAEVDVDTTLEGDHVGLWGSVRRRLGRLTAEAGLRLDRTPADGDGLLSPRLNLAWRLGEGSVLRAAWGRFGQSQRPYELRVEDGETELLAAERSTHALLGYEAELGRGGPVEAVRLELYHRRVANPHPRTENLLEPLNYFPEVEPDRVRVAASQSTFRGAELTLRGGRYGWRGWLSYGLARAEDRLAGRSVPRPLDQRHSLALQLSRPLPGAWGLSLAWRYHSGWPTTPVEAVLLPDDPGGPDGDPDGDPELAARFGELRSRRLPAYHRLDLRLSRRWRRPWGAVTLHLDVQNLYDRQNRAGFDLLVDDEAGTVVLEEEGWPGIFPSVGLTWEFGALPQEGPRGGG